jgi:hypothetical protein
MMNLSEPRVCSLPRTQAAAVAFRVSGQPDIPGLVGPAFDRAWDAMQAAGAEAGLPIAWYVMDATGIDCWVGFESATAVAGLELVELPEAAEAVAVQHFGGPAGIEGAWQAAFAWLGANGATPSAPGREVYLSSDPGDEDSWVTEIQQPFTRH